MRNVLLFTLAVLCAPHSAVRAEGEEVALGRSLSLQDCLLRALRENPELKSEQLNVLIGKEELLTELAAFAWSFEASSVYEHRDKPQNAREASANNATQSNRLFGEDNWRSRVGFSKRFSPGTTVDIGARHSVSENDLTRNPLFSSLGTEHEMFMGVTMTQPLLRGLGREINLGPAEVARLKAESARMLTLIKAMNLLAEVAARYTDVVSAQKQLEVKSQNIERAKSLVARNKRLLESGKGVEKDVLSAELAVFQRNDDYLVTRLQKIQQVNSLAALINLPPDNAQHASLIPVSGFGLEGNLPDRPGLIAQALRNRADLTYYRNVIKSAGLNIRQAANDAKPSLNLVGSAGLYGLDKSTSAAMENAIEHQGGEVSLGLEFRLELGGQTGKSAIEIAKQRKEQAELGYNQARHTISLEVDTAYRRVLNARQRLQTVMKARNLARRNLEAEERLLEEGKGDIYRVIERQQLYGDSSARVVGGQAVLSKAVIALWLASGQLFERYGISEERITAEVDGLARSKQNERTAPDLGSFGVPIVDRSQVLPNPPRPPRVAPQPVEETPRRPARKLRFGVPDPRRGR